MREIFLLFLLSVSFCYCQLDGKFWWTDSRVAKFHKIKIPEPVIEDISPFETDESAKIVFRDEFPSQNSFKLKPIFNNKKFIGNTSPDICHYVKKRECRGVIYSIKYSKSNTKGPREPQLICCLETPRQPLQEDSKIYFPGFRNTNNYINRISKRSVKMKEAQEEGRKEKEGRKPKRPSKERDPQTDYDEDPYWNIKNSNSYKPQINQEEVVTDESVDELPRPGLIGIYSDDENTPEWSIPEESSSSTYDSGSEYDDVDDTPPFGYSAIDPRGEIKTPKRKLKPLRQQPPTVETPSKPKFQIISFQSSPDFKVFEGFKFLNLAKNIKNRPEESTDDNRSKELLFNKPLEFDYLNSDEYFSAENDKIFSDCGKSVQIKEKDQQRGEAPVGSHPWLALVFHNKRRNSFLCYASLIHPRAAVTVASCVNNITSPSELTLITGMQYTNRRPRVSNRISKIILHPDYSPGDLANDLSLLILQVSLKLSVTIQPACLADPDNGQGCMFFGWNEFGSGMRSRSWWQRGKIRTCNFRSLSTKGEDLPSDSFCVSVEPRHSLVTGLGGPLVCNVSGRDALVGVLVRRRHTPVLLPVQKWVMQSTDIINEET